MWSDQRFALQSGDPHDRSVQTKNGAPLWDAIFKFKTAPV
jgi:hypothetical protein